MEPATYYNTSGHPIPLENGTVVETDAFVNLRPAKFDEEGKLVSGNAGPSVEAAIDAGHLIVASKPEKTRSGGNE